MTKKELFSIENGKINRNGNTVLEDLSLCIYQGEITGIIFDSILDQHVFCGFLKGEFLPESGSVYLYGKQVSLCKLVDQLSAMVSVIGSKGNLIDSITVEDNVFLFSDRSKCFSETKEYRQKLMELWERFQLSGEVPKRVKNLNVKQKVIIGLLKAYVEEKKIVVFDGITDVLSEEEMNEIFKLVKMLKEDISFLVTVGFEDVVVKCSDAFAVIQNGKTTYMGRTEILHKNLNEILKSLLLGHFDRDYAIQDYKTVTEKKEKEVFRIMNGSTDYLNELSFSMGVGEILKIYCADEESKNHFWGILTGERSLVRGWMTLDGKAFSPRNMTQAIKMGAGFVTEAPYRTMMMDNLNVLENLSIPLNEKISGFWWSRKYLESVWRLFPYIASRKERIKNMDNEQLQKIAYEKWALYLPKFLVIENPFFDLDVNMREITINMIENLREKGISILILTSSFSTMKKIKGRTIYLKKGKMEEKW